MKCLTEVYGESAVTTHGGKCLLVNIIILLIYLFTFMGFVT